MKMSVFYHHHLFKHWQIACIKPLTMQRKIFLRNSLLAAPALLLGKSAAATASPGTRKKPFVVSEGKSRFGDIIKFRGEHPNDLKISSKDTGGQLSVFEYTGLAKVGPALHMHLYQDEIFMVTEGEYRFVVGADTYTLRAGETIFLPRMVPHTWIQLSDHGKLIYFLQPAGKMEAFFTYMNNLKSKPSPEEIARIHEAHGMKIMGPPLSL